MSKGEVSEPTAEGFYQIGDPTEQNWWNDAQGYNEVDAVRDVFNEAGVEPVYGHQEEFISPDYAFSEEDIESVQEAVEEVYSGYFDQFVDEKPISDVHPQQSQQISKYTHYESSDFIDSIPTEFQSHDGMPVIDANMSRE